MVCIEQWHVGAVQPRKLLAHMSAVDFNRDFPKGTKVIFWPSMESPERDRIETEISGPAICIGNCHVIAPIRGFPALVSITHLEVM